MTELAPRFDQPDLTHPVRDWMSVELALPAGGLLVEHLLDRIERREREQ